MTGSVSSTSLILTATHWPRNHDKNNRYHQEGKNDKHGILHESHQITDLHSAALTSCAPTQMMRIITAFSRNIIVASGIQYRPVNNRLV